MLSPSDFNNAVPQFTNGTYASNPLNPQYIAEPNSTDYNRGTEPLQTLPAQWWNWFINKFTGRFNKVNIYVKNLFNELAQLLSLVSMSPDGTEGTPTVGQLKCMFQCEYPTYLKDTTAMSSTYVPQTTMVNGHALCGNITITCVACAGANGSGTAFGTASTVNTGTAVGCIPTVGTALGTTDGQFLATDASGKLKPSGYCASSFRATTWNPNCLTNIVDGITYCAYICCGNTFNITPSEGRSWINYVGGSSQLRIGDGSGTGTLGTICASCFCGNATYATAAGLANTATCATSATHSCFLCYTGVGTSVVSAFQSIDSFCGSEATWASYLIFAHGNGETYYNQILRMPFSGIPQYQKKVCGTNLGWATFITTENIGSQSVCCATSATSATCATTASSHKSNFCYVGCCSVCCGSTCIYNYNQALYALCVINHNVFLPIIVSWCHLVNSQTISGSTFLAPNQSVDLGNYWNCCPNLYKNKRIEVWTFCETF